MRYIFQELGPPNLYVKALCCVTGLHRSWWSVRFFPPGLVAAAPLEVQTRTSLVSSYLQFIASWISSILIWLYKGRIVAISHSFLYFYYLKASRQFWVDEPNVSYSHHQQQQHRYDIYKHFFILSHFLHTFFQNLVSYWVPTYTAI